MACAQVTAVDRRAADLEARMANMQTTLTSQSQEMSRLQAQVNSQLQYARARTCCVLVLHTNVLRSTRLVFCRCATAPNGDTKEIAGRGGRASKRGAYSHIE